MVLSPTPGSSVAVYYGAGADSEYADEAMSEVNLSAQGRTRYTVYRITDAAKRILDDTEVPVFEKQIHGAGDWVTLTPTEIWYGAGYIVCTALNSDDLVRCHTGHYLTPLQLFGCVTRSFDEKTVVAEVTCYGDTAAEKWPTLDDWAGKLDALCARLCASYTTSGGAANSHIKIIHHAGGVAGNAYSLQIVTPAGSDPIAVTAVAGEVIITPPTGATAIQCINALNAYAAFKALNLRAEIPGTETGAGAVTTLAHTHLAGGRDPIEFSTLKGTKIVLRFYDVYASGIMHVGFGRFESLDWSGKPSDPIKCSISVSGAAYPLYQVEE